MAERTKRYRYDGPYDRYGKNPTSELVKRGDILEMNDREVAIALRLGNTLTPIEDEAEPAGTDVENDADEAEGEAEDASNENSGDAESSGNWLKRR